MSAPDVAGRWVPEGETGQAHLTLQADGTLTGHDGCNQFTGQRWLLDAEGGPEGGGVVRCHGERIQTLKACIDVDTWLASAETFPLDGDALVALSSDGSVLGRLVRG